MQKEQQNKKNVLLRQLLVLRTCFSTNYTVQTSFTKVQKFGHIGEKYVFVYLLK